MAHGSPPAAAAPLSPASDARAERFAARLFLRQTLAGIDPTGPVSTLPRVRACGFDVLGASDVGVRVAADPTTGKKRAGFIGLETCGNGAACPVCAAKVAGQRVEEMRRAVAHHLDHGGTAAMLTLTMRHRRGDTLADLWDGLTGAWRAATGTGAFRRDRAEFGVLGWARAVEATHGANGWHLHIHAVLFFHGQPTAADLATLGHRVFGRWREWLRGHGYRTPIATRGGLDIRAAYGDDIPALLAGYLTKAGSEQAAAVDTTGTADTLGMEAAGGAFKRARLGNRTPWQVLGDLRRTPTAADLAVWREWEQAAAGRRRLAWSRYDDGTGLWAGVLAARGEELTDEEIAAQVEGETVGFITAAEWRAIRRNEGLASQMLTAAETGGSDALAALLLGYGVAMRRPPPHSVAA